MFSIPFWKATLERCAKTCAQTAAALIAATSFDWFSADWRAIAGTMLTAGVLSVLTSIASAGVGDKGTPSVVAAPTNAALLPPGAEIA